MKFADGGVGRIAVAGKLEVGLDIRNTDMPGELFIVDGPDSKILVPDELLFHIYLGNHPGIDKTIHTDITLERRTEGHGSTGHAVGDYGCHSKLGRVCHFGSILRIKTVEQQLVYMVGEYEPEIDAWWCQWPD